MIDEESKGNQAAQQTSKSSAIVNMELAESDNEESYPELKKVPGHYCFNIPKKVLAFTRDINIPKKEDFNSVIGQESSKNEQEKEQLVYYFCSWLQDYEDYFYVPSWIPSPYIQALN
jgi:hypothetical protein